MNILQRSNNVHPALYTDNSIPGSPDQEEIVKIIEDLKRSKLILNVEGDLQDFLGVSIEIQGDGTINLMQPHLIDHILADLHLTKGKVKIRDTPVTSSKLL